MAEYKVKLTRVDRLYCWSQALLITIGEGLIWMSLGFALLAQCLSGDARANAVMLALACSSTGLLAISIKLFREVCSLKKMAGIRVVPIQEDK